MRNRHCERAKQSTGDAAPACLQRSVLPPLATTNESRQERLRDGVTNKLSPIPRPPNKPVVGNMLSLDPTLRFSTWCG